jgi:hypothetical protein
MKNEMYLKDLKLSLQPGGDEGEGEEEGNEGGEVG